MYNLLRSVYVLVFMLWAIILPAQPEVPGYDICRIGMQSGLENQVITAVVRDPSDALWFGTLNGLYRYDGFRTVLMGGQFKTYPEQLYAHITNLCIDPDPGGLIFVSTKYRPRIVDPYTGAFLSSGDIGIPDSIFDHFSQIVRGGNCFFGLREQTIYKINKIGIRQFECRPWYHLPGDPAVVKLAVDPGDPEAVWLLLENERAVWHAGPQGVRRYSLPESQKNLPEAKGLVQMMFTRKGILGWDLARSIYKFDAAGGFKNVNHPSGLYSLVPDLVAVDIAMKQKESLRCLLYLDINQVVLGTTLGMFIVRKKISGFSTIEALREKEIRGIHSDSTGKWTIGTYDGLYTGRFGDDRVTKYPDIKIVWDFLPLRKGLSLLALERRNGLMLWDPVSEEIVDSSLVYRLPDPKDATSVLSIEQDAYGIKWAGSYSNLMWSPPDSPFAFRPYRNPEDSSPFGHTFIRAILAAQDSSLWVGADDGLYHLHYSPTWKQYRFETRVSLVDKVTVSDIYEDRFKNIWVATKGKGIALLPLGIRPVQWFNTDNGLCDNMVCRIEGSREDSVLWISTHNGLSRLEVGTGVFHNFHEDSGFPGNEFNSAASTRNKDGTLLFGGINGVILFHPDSIQVAGYRYKTSVPYVQVYQGGIDTLLAFHQYAAGLYIDAYPELLEFVLGSNELIHPGKIRYRYRLLGLSDKWNYTTGENKVKFVHLSPGSYKFEVQAVPLDGHFGARFTLPVFVATPFYETWWFRAFILGIIILIAYGAYRYRLRQVLKEQLVRQQVADDLHDDIGNKLNIIGIIAQKVAGFLVKNKAPLPSDSSLEKLMELSRETQISLITMIWAVDPSKDRLANLITRMQDFADDFVRPLLPHFSFSAPDVFPDRDLNLRVRHHLMLIYQELLVNMIKHTHSTRISVAVKLLEGDKIALSLRNQFQSDQNETYKTISGNRGQNTLNRRLKEINAKMDFDESEPGLQKINLVVPQIFK